MAGTLIIGDDTAGVLEAQLRKIPGTLPIWADVQPRHWLDTWSGARIADTISSIAEGSDSSGPVSPPSLVLVAAGRSEIAAEPPNVKPEDFDAIRGDINKILDAIRDAGATVAWVLPPKQPIERQARNVMIAELSKRGVKTFDASKRNYPQTANGDLVADGPWRLGVDVSRWLPLGRAPFQIVPRVSPPSPSSIISDLPQKAADAAATTGGKVFLGVVGLGVVAGGLYFATKGRRRG